MYQCTIYLCTSTDSLKAVDKHYCPGLHVSAAMVEANLHIRCNQTLAWNFIILLGGERVEGGGGRWHFAKGEKTKSISKTYLSGLLQRY